MKPCKGAKADHLYALNLPYKVTLQTLIRVMSDGRKVRQMRG